MTEQTLNPWLKRLLNVSHALKIYHRYRLEGIEQIPKTKRCLIVVNHSLATYDALLLTTEIFQQTQRLPKALGDRLIFKIPYFRDWASQVGIVQGQPNHATQLLEQEELVMVAPGGMLEALRPSHQKRELCWEHRLGFVKLALQTNTPIVLAACPAADDIFDVYPSHITRSLYNTFRVPVPVFKGLGLSAIPKPVQLTSYLDATVPVPHANLPFDERVHQYHTALIERMQSLMQKP